MSEDRPIVLVVEDHQETRELFVELLEPEGYAVETAADGAAALAQIEARGFHLVLLGRFLADMDGLELCQQVRTGESESRLPIIMVTTSSAEAQQQAGLAAGADAYVTKPFDIDELLDRVQTCLDQAIMT